MFVVVVSDGGVAVVVSSYVCLCVVCHLVFVVRRLALLFTSLLSLLCWSSSLNVCLYQVRLPVFLDRFKLFLTHDLISLDNNTSTK